MNSEYRKLLSYALAGVLGTALHWLMYTLLLNLGVAPLPSTSAGAMLGALCNYMANYKLVFASSRPHRRVLPKFLSVAAAGFFINGAIVWGLQDVGVWLAQAVATLAVLFVGYLLNSRWSFVQH